MPQCSQSSVPTLKDIAAKLGLSIGTVERALHNKGGYSAKTQARVLEEAARCGYVANPAASALRRAPINIAVVLPEPVDEDRYFFQYVWQGIDRALQELSVYKVQTFRHYADTNSDEFIGELEKMLEQEDPLPNGLITFTSTLPELSTVLDKYATHKIPVFLLNASEPSFEKYRYTLGAHHGVGKLGADIFSAIHKNTTGKLLVLGGSRTNIRQSTRANDFCTFVNRFCPRLTLMETHSYDRIQSKEFIRQYAKAFDDFVGIYAVSARETLGMCESVHELGLSGKLTTVGMDVFPELLPYFEDDTLTASIYQYPAQQGYVAVKRLVSHITGAKEESSASSFTATVAFKSNAAAFTSNVFLMFAP